MAGPKSSKRSSSPAAPFSMPFLHSTSTFCSGSTHQQWPSGCSSIFSFVYLFSTLLMLASCRRSAKGIAGPLRRTECYVGIEGEPIKYGISMGTWAVFQACNLLSAIAYGYHAALAYYVLRGINQRKAAGIEEVENPEVIAARRAKAQAEWIKMTCRGL